MVRTAAILLALTGAALAQQAPWYGGQATGNAYPNGSTPLTASASGTTAAVSATLPAAGQTVFLCGFAITSAGSTTAEDGMVTVTGTIGGTLNFAYEAPATGQGALVVPFRPCIPGNMAGTSIVVTQPAAGAGAIAAVTAWGYRL